MTMLRVKFIVLWLSLPAGCGVAHDNPAERPSTGPAASGSGRGAPAPGAAAGINGGAIGGQGPRDQSSGSGAAGTASPDAEQRYVPLSVGALWTYAASDATGRTGQTQSQVEAFEDVGGEKAGIMAFRVRNTLLSGGSMVNWQEDRGDSVVRHRAEFIEPSGVVRSTYVYMPSRLRLDESDAHMVPGTTWTEMHSAIVNGGASAVPATFTVTWTLEAIDEAITVPGGTFSCLRVRRVQTGFASSDEMHWYARGVGKVKETGPEIKDLVSYSIP